jgi:serine-type D-Ala-D-Ala carboxypeptidase/endopeptidase (penicillin-binding protein 4)
MRIKIVFIIVNLLLVGCSSYNQDSLYKEKPAFYSYVIGDIKGGHIDKEYASNAYSTPASCQKTITALVALKALGSDYYFETKLFAKKNQNSIQDIIISFSGDPTFSSDNLISLLKPLEGAKVKGSILIDASLFKTPPYSPNLMVDDIGTDYASPVSSFILDKNFINIKVLPNKIGRFATIQIDADYRINSEIITGAESSSIKVIWDGNIIKAVGTIDSKSPPLELHISPQEINSYVVKKVDPILKLLNITGKIKIIYDKNQLPSNLILVNQIKSQPLKKIIMPALKKSDNLVFDILYLTILHSYSTEEIKDWNKGDAIIKELVKQYFNIDFEKALFVDGSGLSRYNRVQAKALFALLKKGFLVPDFVESLAKPGEEKSTLLKRNTLPNSIKAKTGNMTGISCLCGYSFDSNDTSKVFVFMVNGFAPPSEELFIIIDEFIKKQLKLL